MGPGSALSLARDDGEGWRAAPRGRSCAFLSDNNGRSVWVPAFAGTTSLCYGVAIPSSFSAASIRAGGCIGITIAFPVSNRLLRLERIAGQP